MLIYVYYIALFACRKVLLETKIYFVHLNLCIALLLSLITFVSGIETASDHRVILISLCHHYGYVAILLRLLNA